VLQDCILILQLFVVLSTCVTQNLNVKQFINALKLCLHEEKMLLQSFSNVVCLILCHFGLGLVIELSIASGNHIILILSVRSNLVQLVVGHRLCFVIVLTIVKCIETVCAFALVSCVAR
jgi:hypothetical protein